MEQESGRAIERAIIYMHENLGERITIDDIARRAMFSKFHFSRLFQRLTGLSPGRFLSAIRLQHAKELLLSTDLSVIDIGHRVGYNSAGTFSSRFRESVGLSPSAYRRQRGLIEGLPDEAENHAPDSRTATVRGYIRSPRDGPVRQIFVGLFPTRLPHGTPARSTLLQSPGEFLLDNVAPGNWYLIAYTHTSELVDPLQPGTHIAAHGPITVHPNDDVRVPDLALRPVSVFDPPALFARFDGRTVAANGHAVGVLLHQAVKSVA